jgi:hypothetical protein
MRTIWKIDVEVADVPLVAKLPVGATVVHVGTQHPDDPRTVQVWLEVNDAGPVEERSFRIIGTGHAMPENARYVGSAIVYDGQLVWHVVEV